MTVKERILALHLIEKQGRDPIYMEWLGVSIQIKHEAENYQNKEGGEENE